MIGFIVLLVFFISSTAYTCIDLDGDGYGNPGDPTCPKGSYIDCDDSNPDINPGATEGPPIDASCSDNVDNDCDGLADAKDSRCQYLAYGYYDSTGWITSKLWVSGKFDQNYLGTVIMQDWLFRFFFYYTI